MKGSKLVLCAVCAIITIVAAAAAIAIFRDEIVGMFLEVKERVEKAGSKILHKNGEYTDYADV